MKSILLVGAGDRAYELFIKPLQTEVYPDSKIVGIYDINIKRAEFLSTLAPYSIPVFKSLDESICTCDPDLVVIMTPDYTHVPLIVFFLRNTDSIIFCEKPLCITLDQALRLNQLPISYKKRIFVLLNSRFMPINSEIKRILTQGYIGTPLSIQYNWHINSEHGAEYFHRWHSDINKSGDLIVHKSCHHFDLLNWWLEDTPFLISGTASKSFFISNQNHGENCRNCNNSCKYRINTNKNPIIQKMYFDVESEDGYIRDKCIYLNSTIHDTLSTSIQYKKKTVVNYSIDFYNSDYSWDLYMIGSHGTLFTSERHNFEQNEIILKLFSGEKKTIIVPKSNMKHCGADLKLRKNLLSNNDIKEKSIYFGSCRDGISASIIGILSNKSQEEGIICENPFITN